MIHTSHDLPETTRSQMIDVLNQQLADTFDLYSQVKQAHWNVKGPNFQQLHELFDEVALGVLPFVDEIAERATALGGAAHGTARMTATTSRLDEMSAEAIDGPDAVRAVAKALAGAAATTRAAIDSAADAGDEGTADLFTGISRDLDKLLWFVEAHAQTA